MHTANNKHKPHATQTARTQERRANEHQTLNKSTMNTQLARSQQETKHGA